MALLKSVGLENFTENGTWSISLPVKVEPSGKGARALAGGCASGGQCSEAQLYAQQEYLTILWANNILVGVVSAQKRTIGVQMYCAGPL